MPAGILERRGAVRFPIDQEVRCKLFNGKTIEAGARRTLNLSSSGVLFTTGQRLAPGDRVELSVNWPAQLDYKHPLKLVAGGRVVRVTAEAAAIVIDRYEFRTQGAHGLNSH